MDTMPFVGVLWVYRAVANELRAILCVVAGCSGLAGETVEREHSPLSPLLWALWWRIVQNVEQFRWLHGGDGALVHPLRSHPDWNDPGCVVNRGC